MVGADGLHSNVRSLAFTLDGAAETHLGYYAAAFSTAGYPHRDEGAYVSYAAPGRQLARYALRGDRTAFFLVWVDERAVAAPPHDAGTQKAILREHFTGLGWESDEIVAALDRSDDLYFDAVAQARLADWWRGRVALVGDAAYCPSLLAGEGAGFAMAGAYLLAWALAAAGGDHLQAFREYQRRFKPFVDAKQRAALRFAGWFAPRTRMGVQLRNLATNLFGWPVIGELLAARSFGDRFELPG